MELQLAREQIGNIIVPYSEEFQEGALPTKSSTLELGAKL